MTNYRRYQPYRRNYRASRRPWLYLGWAAVALILLLLLRNTIGGEDSGGTNDNTNGSITLANSGNENRNSSTGASSTPTIAGRNITTKECTKAISQATPQGQYVAVTLDGGGITGDALKVLDVIKERQIPVTLFISGKWSEDNAEIVKAYAEANIEVFSRGYARDPYTSLAKEKVAADVEKAEAAILDVTGKVPKPFLRPPQRAVNDDLVRQLRTLGYCTTFWTVDALDANEGITVDESKQRVIDRLENGAIIRMLVNSDIAVELLPVLTDEIKAKGYTLVTLRDLLRQPEGTNTNANVNSN